MNRIQYINDFPSWAERFDYSHLVKVRFSETDMFGHLNNTVPFTYFEEARIEFFKSKGLKWSWTKEYLDTIMVTADLQCNYLKQVFFDEQLTIHVKADTVGTSSADIHYMAKNENGEVCFVGRGTVVHISSKTGKGEPWPEELKNALESDRRVMA